MKGINGIIISGKVYETVDSGADIPCQICELRRKCNNHRLWDACRDVFGVDSFFRFSQTLTDKLNDK